MRERRLRLLGSHHRHFRVTTLFRILSGFRLLIPCALLSVAGTSHAEEQVHLYNWSDYVAEDTLPSFQEKTKIRPVLDVYDSNEVLEAKLLAGSSGYDLIFPTARPFAARHIKAGLYQKLDKSKLPGLDRLDPDIMNSLAAIDPGNQYLVPYMWGTSGLGLNLKKVKAALGEQAELDTWSLIFDPKKAEKLADCGISLLDDPVEVLPAVLAYLGKNPNSMEKADLDAAAAVIKSVRPYIRYFHSSQYINDLANGDLCAALGYSGDIMQARSRAEEARKGVEIGFRIPREGAVIWTDVMAIPKDAPNPAGAHAFIAHILDPKVVASISDVVFYANPNLAATPLLKPELRDDPGVYPSAEVKTRLFVNAERSDPELRKLNRLWTRLKSSR